MLLRLDHEGVKKLISDYDKAVANIKKICLKLTWYMRGGVSYTDILNMSSIEREMINKIVEENLELTKKTQMPFI